MVHFERLTHSESPERSWGEHTRDVSRSPLDPKLKLLKGAGAQTLTFPR